MNLGKKTTVRIDEYGAAVQSGERSVYKLVTPEIEVRSDAYGAYWCCAHNCQLDNCKESHMGRSNIKAK